MRRWRIFVGGAFIAGLGAVGWQFMQPPPAQVGHSMITPDMARLEDGASIVEVKLPLELSPDAQIGKRAFDAKCAACHGDNAAGQKGAAPPLVHKIYEPSHHADMTFVMAVQNGVRAHHWPFGNMPPVEGLTQGAVKYITRYVRELQRENGIE